MPIFIRNSTPNLIYVAVGYYNQGCSPQLAKRGWYQLEPGRTFTAFGGRLNHEFFRFYAEDDFGHVWGGSDFTDVPQDAFDMCWIASCASCRRVGFKNPLYGGCPPIIGCPDRTLNLVLTSSQKRSKSKQIINVVPSKRKLKYRKYRHGIINKMKSKKVLKPGKTRK